ncbi:methyl-accepting chemotaxis protein [Rhodothalassium salexigens]|uniref:methyl-accepting chemotaxis protein n=1 Tax=Rhodothalassium salexigens TaxID=1086 RepID=UPI0019122CD3
MSDRSVSTDLAAVLDALLDGQSPDLATLDGRSRALVERVQTLARDRRLLDEQLSLYFEHSGVGLFDHILDETRLAPGQPQTTYSAEMRRMLGYRDEADFPNEFSSFSNSLHPDDKERVEAAFAAHLMDKTDRTPFDIRYRLRRKTGEFIWVRALCGTRRDRDGNPLRACGSTFDIDTEKRRSDLLETLLERTRATLDDARSAVRVVESGVAQVQAIRQAVDAMADLSTQISQLTGEIQAIAKQTNLLALNATIEAARAGEAGRGFAVVAGEVKALAKNSHQMADRITDLVDQSVTTSKGAGKGASGVITAMDDIRTATETVKTALETLDREMSR